MAHALVSRKVFGDASMIVCVVAIAIVLILLVALAVSGSTLAISMIATIIGLVVGFGVVHLPYLFFRRRRFPESFPIRKASIVALVLAVALSLIAVGFAIALVDTTTGYFFRGFGIGLLIRAATLLRDHIVRRRDV